MKIRVSIKDPDVFSEAIDGAVETDVQSLHLSDDECEAIAEMRRSKVGETLARWLQYGEYIVVEFDTEAGTATVVPVAEWGEDS